MWTPKNVKRFAEQLCLLGLRVCPMTQSVDIHSRSLFFMFVFRFSAIFCQFHDVFFLVAVLVTSRCPKDIQSTAPANLLSALGLPEGHCFRGRGVIWATRLQPKRIVESQERSGANSGFRLKVYDGEPPSVKPHFGALTCVKPHF